MRIDLTELAFQILKGMFIKIGHTPSHAQLLALYDILHTLTRIANGELETNFCLSSLHPGIGKSTAIISWVRAYQQCRNEYGDYGVIMCFDRHEEITRMIDDLKLPIDTYAVKVADTEENRRLNGMGLGSSRIDDALILLTTKQQIYMPGERGRDYRDLSNLYYHGKPRTIRIWDESLTCGVARKLIIRKLVKLPDDLHEYPSIAAQIEHISDKLRTCKNMDSYDIQDLSANAKHTLSSFKWSSQEARDTANSLLQLLGRQVTVRSSAYGCVAIDCDDSVPDGFAPCLVTDASGEVRGAYTLQEQYRKNLVRLKTAAKDYSKLTVHVWRQGSGKTAYKDNGNDLYVKEIVKVINSRPDEQFLVLRFLDNPDLEAEIRKQVLQPERVLFTHYGVHTATNMYRDCPNMIVTGIMDYRAEDYEALARAAAGLNTSEGVLAAETINDFRHGEYAHHLLQAVCRIRVRKSEGAGCPEARVWLIAPKGRLPDNEVGRIFPGCTVQRWITTPRSLKGPRQVAFGYIMDMIASGIKQIRGADVRTYLGMTKSNFTRDIIQNENFSDTLRDRDVCIEKRSNGHYYFNDTSYLRQVMERIYKGNQAPITTIL